MISRLETRDSRLVTHDPEMPRLPDSLPNAISLRQADKGEQALKMLQRLLKKEPNSAQLHFHAAWTCDGMGRERAAVPYYERALVLGLEGDDLRGALLGLGSTYRTLGEYDKAIATCKTGLEFFPAAREFEVFLSIALYNVGQHNEAMQRLLRTLAETSNDEGIQSYRQAILFYSEHLDEIWK